jgi:uncharacterized protein YbjT (DUF2867 family)
MASKNDDTILVVGATGFLGIEICRRLIATNRKVRGMIRSTSDQTRVKALQDMGVETVTGDIKNPSSLDEAMKGVSTVISTATSTVSRQEGDSIETVDNTGQLNVVEAAKKAGVKYFVFISFHPMSQEFPLQTAKRNVERALVQSGMDYTILQPTMFMEVWLSPFVGFNYPEAKATIYGDGQNKICWVSLQDVAALAVASLDNAGALNKVFEIGGPEALSPLEVVSIFEQCSGKQFGGVDHVPVEALIAQKKAAPDSLSQSFNGLMIAYAEEKLIPMEETIKILPVQLRTVKEYATMVSKA